MVHTRTVRLVRLVSKLLQRVWWLVRSLKYVLIFGNKIKPETEKKYQTNKKFKTEIRILKSEINIINV